MSAFFVLNINVNKLVLINRHRSESSWLEMSKEELLETYFTFISNFSHDRAREVVEKEKEAARTGSSFTQLLGALVTLAGAEKQFLSLSFLLPRPSSVFLRKEQSLKSLYQAILLDLSNALELEKDAVVSRTCEDLLRLLQVRVSMIAVYEKLSQFSAATAPSSYSDLVANLSLILEELQQSQSPLCEQWVVVLQYEAGLLLDCLSLTETLQQWNFFDSLMLLQRAAERLARWEVVAQARETRKLSFASSWLRGVSSTEPHLYLWFQKLKSALLSKFSLYFYSTLSKQTNSSEMKVMCSKLSLDQSARICSFQKRLDCQSVSLLYDATGQTSYQGRPGYHFTEKDPAVAQSGLDLFPVVFSTGQPGHHWPNIVMILSDHSEELRADRTVHFFDGGVAASYFLHQIEARFYIVLIFEGRRNEKDSTINSFIQETASQLSCVRIFASLKPGYK